MTSGNFTLINPTAIIINREGRQRRVIDDVETLAASIRTVGLINPPVIDRNNNLVAGERRLTAVLSLGWTSIPVQYTDELEPTQLQLVELEENVKRKALTWKDHNDAVSSYHKLRSENDDAWSRTATAEALNISEQSLGQHLLVADARKEGIGGVEDAESYSVARNIAKRSRERSGVEAAGELEGLLPPPTKERAPAAPRPASTATESKSPDPLAEEVPSPARSAALINDSFIDWSSREQPHFNLIHCDFPYGVNAGDKKGMSAAKIMGTYADTREIYFELLDAFTSNQDNFISESAHLVFWFSMDYYQDTVDILEGAGWRVSSFPLIWHKSDNAGILPDPNRGPRRTYETALFASRGDRKIVRPVANSFSGPTTRELHTSEKPRAMLHHFFRMLVDHNTVMLDPTAGSANSVVEAEAMGAKYALGIEMDPEFYARSKEAHEL